MKNWLTVTVFLFLLSLTFTSHASIQRLDDWGQGASEFEAVKSAYKKIFAKALKLTVAKSGTIESEVRRTLEREIEEDLLKIKNSFAPSADESCTRDQAAVECIVVAPLLMDELEAWVRKQIQVSGRGGSRISGLSYALVTKSSDAASKDFTIWLHSKLEQDFGHTVFLSRDYVDPSTLSKNCEPYRQQIAAKKKSGGNFARVIKAYQKSLDACENIIKQDVVIVLDELSITTSPYQSSNKSMEGQAKINLSIVDTRANRLLPAPKPRPFMQYGYGESSNMAQADLYGKLNEAGANYISQQFNDLVLTAGDAMADKKESGKKRYMVSMSGINSDLAADRKMLRFVRNWFEDEKNLALEADYERGDSAEKIYHFESSEAIKWDRITDDLYDALDEENYPVRIDVDRNSNLTISFKADDKKADKKIGTQISFQVNNKKLRKRIKVKTSDMVIRRRDQLTGVAMSLHEANVHFQNKSKNDLFLVVSSIWYTAEGVEQRSPFDDDKYLVLKAKTTKNLVLRAPSRFAEKVSLEVDCAEKGCKAEAK